MKAARRTAATLAIICAVTSPMLLTAASYVPSGERAYITGSATLFVGALALTVLWWLAGGGPSARR